MDAGEDAVAEADEDMGSNMWAFAPSRTESGKAILMGNPHQAWSDVATYYEAHVTIPGTYNFYGTTFVGRPVLTTGFNDHLGWTHTVNYPDLEEIYALDLDPLRANHYLFDGGSVPMRSETHTVKVRSDKGMLDVKRTFWHTPLGPVIHRTEDQVFVLKSAAYGEYRFYQQWYRMGQAQNWLEFQEALRIMAIPMFNTGYADDQGNIYYIWYGTVPDIPLANQTNTAMHARQSGDVWTRFHELHELPQWLNPEGGYIFNSNSAPYLTNLHSPVKRVEFPDHFPDNRLSLRSQLSLLLVHNDNVVSLEDVVELKHDMRALLADRVKDDLIAAVLQRNPDAATRDAVQRLYNWDNTVARESRGSVLFKTWWDVYSKIDNRERPAEENFAVQWDEADPISTPQGLADPERAVTAFQEAMADLSARYGTWDVAWGDVHRLRRGDVDVPVGGDGNALGCFRIIDYRRDADGKFVPRGGDGSIFAVEFGETPRAYTIVAYSQSGNEDSPYHADQSVLFADERMKAAAFTEEAIQEALVMEYHPGEER
jgi:acyl-homoserine-lactone acylase